MAERVNHLWGAGTLVVPELYVSDAPLVPGLDGKKMSKSQGNSVPLFEDAKALRKLVMKFVTGSEPLEAPKPSDGTTVFELYKLVASESEVQAMREKLAGGGTYGWGHAKQDLYEVLERELGGKRATYAALRADEAKLDAILDDGAAKARVIARRTLERVRSAIGIAKPR
jgi:tryptophanyl-tRNA synthetase